MNAKKIFPAFSRAVCKYVFVMYQMSRSKEKSVFEFWPTIRSICPSLNRFSS